MTPSEIVKEKILTTAADLFYRQGYNSTGINQIIDEAGIARGSLYNHFKSKTELLHAYLEDSSNNWFVQLYAYIDKIYIPKDKILGLFDFRIKRQVRSGFGGCPFIKAGAEVPQDEKKAFKIIDENKMRFRDYILELLQNVSPQNDLLTKEELADTIYLLIEGATITASFQKRNIMIGRAKEIVGRLL